MKIINYFPVNKGAVIANFSVQIEKMGNLIIRDCTLFEKDGKSWVSLPSKMVEKDGKKNYFPYISFEDKHMNETFKEKIRHAAEERRLYSNQENKKPDAFDEMDADEIPF